MMRDGLRSKETVEGPPVKASSTFPSDIKPEGSARMPGGFTQFPNRIIDLGIWEQMPDVACRVYLVFCRFSDDSNITDLSLKKLAALSGLSKSSAKRAKAWLTKHGLLRVLSMGGRSTSGSVNAYQLQFPATFTPKGSGAEPSDQKRDVRLRKPKSVEYFVYNRDQGRCRYCGKPVHEDYHLEHIIPRSQGGTRTRENTVIACSSCTVQKGARTPEQACMRLLPAPGSFD